MAMSSVSGNKWITLIRSNDNKLYMNHFKVDPKNNIELLDQSLDLEKSGSEGALVLCAHP